MADTRSLQEVWDADQRWWWRIIHRIFGCGATQYRHWWDFDYGLNKFRIQCKRCGKRSVSA